MADKYLARGTGRGTKEVEAVVSSAGAGDAGKIPALDAGGRLDNTMMPTGIGATTKSIMASETLAAGDQVNIWNDAGTVKVRKADGTATGKESHGFVLAGVSSGANATVYFEGEITGLSSLTPGAAYFLATTPGGVTSTPPGASGNVSQYVGTAVSTTSLIYVSGEPIELA